MNNTVEVWNFAHGFHFDVEFDFENVESDEQGIHDGESVFVVFSLK